MGRSSIATAVVTAALLCPSAALADTGTISGATNNGSEIRIENIQVTLDAACDSDYMSYGCTANAYLQPPSLACSEASTENEKATEIWGYWTGFPEWSPEPEEPQSQTINSGPIKAAIPYGRYRLCLLSQHVQWKSWTTFLLAQEVVTPPNYSPPITKREATVETRKALRQRFGFRFTRGWDKQINCTKKGGYFLCRVAWKFKRNARYRGTVAVRGAQADATTRIRVYRYSFISGSAISR